MREQAWSGLGPGPRSTVDAGLHAGLLFHHDKRFVEARRAQIGKFALVFFLPVFFTYAGLRMNVLGLTSASDWCWLSPVLAAAILGKIIPAPPDEPVCRLQPERGECAWDAVNTRALHSSKGVHPAGHHGGGDHRHDEAPCCACCCRARAM